MVSYREKLDQISIIGNTNKVNDVNFEDMGNAEAVEFLRKVVQEPGPLTLTIAKCWDPSPHPMNPYNHQSQAMSHPPGGGDRHSFDSNIRGPPRRYFCCRSYKL